MTTFGYDPAGRLARAANADAVIEIERDAAGRVTAETCNGRTVRSAYDPAGRRIRRLTPSGAETVWDYDPAGRPVTLHAGGQELRFGYDAAGRETTRELPGGVSLAQQWDPAGLLAAQVLVVGDAPAGPAVPLPAGPVLAGRCPPGRRSLGRTCRRLAGRPGSCSAAATPTAPTVSSPASTTCCRAHAGSASTRPAG